MDWVEAVGREAEKFQGTAGVVVSSLADGEGLRHNADRVFSSASLIKLGVLYTLFVKQSSGEIDPGECCEFSSLTAVEGGLLHRTRSGARLRLDDLALLMVSVSDNTAANMLIERLGMDAINAEFKAIGLSSTVLGRKMLDFKAKKEGRDNFTTAGDMALLLETLHSGERLPQEAKNRMMEILSLQKLNTKLPGLIPVLDVDDVEQFLAHKTGELPGNEHDVGIFFYSGKRPVVVSVLTEGLKDRVEGVNFCARIGQLIYTAFHDRQ